MSKVIQASAELHSKTHKFPRMVLHQLLEDELQEKRKIVSLLVIFAFFLIRIKLEKQV
jgi:hypothetical protein